MPAEILERERKNIPIGRLGQLMDVAATVPFLASDETGFMTGATFSVNGGQNIM